MYLHRRGSSRWMLVLKASGTFVCTLTRYLTVACNVLQRSSSKEALQLYIVALSSQQEDCFLPLSKRGSTEQRSKIQKGPHNT
eukprot:scaffold162_cov267-Chaetoceros_neogracile.AAC.45